MSRGFVKIYGDLLLGSSLMDEAVETRWLFMCFAAAADKDGFVRCQTVGVAARLANIPEDQATRALEALSSPDPNSSSRELEGRRIVRVDGGWKLVNHAKYREMRTVRQVKNAERQKKWRSAHPLRVTRVDSMSHEVSASHTFSVSVEGGMGGGVVGEPQLYRPPGPPNPLVQTRRVDLERELCRLVIRESELTNRDGAEVMAEVSHYEGAKRSKLNPATMSDDRLMNSVLDARARVARLEEKHGRPAPR